MNKTYKYTLNAGEKKEITFGVGINRLAISNANGTDGDVTVVTSEITKTDSGDICSFVDGTDAPFADLKVNIEAVQSGSGNPSPENERPISGWTGANISRTGVNIWDEEWEEGAYNSNNGTKVNVLNRIRCKNPIRVVPNATYYFKASSLLTIYAYDQNGNYLSQIMTLQNDTLGVPSNVYFITFNTGVNSGSTYNNDISINYPATDTAYHAYNSNSETINIDWQSVAGTVYGGELNLKTGILTVTHVIDNRPQDLPWGGYQYVEGVFTANIDNKKIGRINIISNKLKTYDGSVTNMPDLNFSGANNNSKVYVRFDAYIGNFSGFKTEIANGYVFIYELATPITYQLTPTEIRSLLGVNNVWADCGSISLKYFVQSTQPLIDYINDEDDRCVYIDCTQSGADTFSITSDITKAEFVSLLNKNKNVKLRLDTGSGDVIFDLSYVTANIADFTCNRTALISDVNSFQSLTLRVDMSGDTLSLSRHAVITIDDGTYEYITGQNNQLIKDGWSWSTQGYDLRDADELLFMITPMPNVASDSDTINGEMQRSSQDPKRALFCKGIKNMLPDVQEIESPFWFNDIVVVGNRATYTSKNDITMKIRVWANYYSSPQHSLADVNFYANCDCNDSTANLWGMCNVFVFKKKR